MFDMFYFQLHLLSIDNIMCLYLMLFLFGFVRYFLLLFFLFQLLGVYYWLYL